MTTLILVCIFNISPTNTGNTQYIPVSNTIVSSAKQEDSNAKLRAECSKAVGSSIDLAYVLK